MQELCLLNITKSIMINLVIKNVNTNMARYITLVETNIVLIISSTFASVSWSIRSASSATHYVSGFYHFFLKVDAADLHLV